MQTTLYSGNHGKLKAAKTSQSKTEAVSKIGQSKTEAVPFGGTWALVCSFCGAAFKTRSGLTEHVKKKHEESFRYYCEICGKGFMIRIQYEEHKNTHLKIPPYQCECCLRRFAYKRSLRTHKCPMRDFS